MPELSFGDRVWRMPLIGHNYFTFRSDDDLSDMLTADDLVQHLPS